MSSAVAWTVKKAWEASSAIGNASTVQKNDTLERIAQAIDRREDEIIQANRKDLDSLEKNGTYSKAFYDRLFLNSDRLHAMSEGLLEIAALPDPIGEVTSIQKRPNGLEIGKVRVPLGVVAIIYEARPNVTVDAAGLGLKSGNSVVLRGSSEAFYSNQALVQAIQEGLHQAGLSANNAMLIEQTDRESARELMRLNKYLDVIIPRGGSSLKKTITENATVPVVETGEGNCHTFVDEDADMDSAVRIVVNAKTQRPGVCNTMETLLIHENIAREFLPVALEELQKANVEVRGCPRVLEYCQEDIKSATEEDWSTEYLDLVLAVKVVKNIHEAISHINTYGTGHSEAILTSSYQRSRIFLQQVDAAAVYVNASTRFTDGNVFGLGAEMGISTQKLHARGPMGLETLTSAKYIILGDGQYRK